MCLAPCYNFWINDRIFMELPTWWPSVELLLGVREATILLHTVVKWSEFLATDTEVPGSIPGATRFSE